VIVPFSLSQAGGPTLRESAPRPAAPTADKEAERMKRAIVAAVIAAGITIGTVGPAFANAPPPTNGGNGAGHSGQCTGNPDDRPASCH
jgi:hypothetical protein